MVCFRLWDAARGATVARGAAVMLAAGMPPALAAQTPPAPAGPPNSVKTSDPPVTSAPSAGGAPAAGEGLDYGMDRLSGSVAWPTVEATTAGSGDGAVEAEVRYAPVITGLSSDLEALFKPLSSLWTKKGSPANLAQINRRATEDRDLIDQLLRSEGYYGGSSAVLITAPAKPGDAVAVALSVTPGPRYTYDSVTVTGPQGATLELAQTALAIKPGDPVVAVKVTEGDERVATKLAESGFPFAKAADPAVTVDHETRTAQLTVAVDTGPRGVFGTSRFGDDTKTFDNAHLAELVRLKRGDPYNALEAEDLRRALIQSGLFGSVSVKPVASGKVNADGTQFVDLVVTTDPAPLRTIATTIGYSTGQGIRFEGSWQHRNLFPPEGGFTVRGVAAEREQLLGAELRRKNFRRRDQTLVGQAEVSFEELDAYSAKTVRVAAALERETNIIWQKKWTYSIGAEVLTTRQRDRSAPTDPAATYLIAALPANLSYDGSNDLLNPERGYRLTGRASPELSYEGGTTLTYAKLQVEGSYYQPFGRIVLAGRLHLGAIAGASRGRIAPSRRFYAGGGGSVRGFGYQAVGPQDVDGAPLGGNSITEASFEARYRFTAFGNDIGLVPFVDVGQVYTSTLPKFDSLRVGAGLGLRYYTSFGPIRIDLATPLTRTPRDPRLAFYVSIGQAF